MLITERGIPPKERLRQQDLYSERMATKEKALVMKQTMTVKQDQFKEVWERMKFIVFYLSVGGEARGDQGHNRDESDPQEEHQKEEDKIRVRPIYQ